MTETISLDSLRSSIEAGEDFILNIGPQHPSTHGVLRLKNMLDGETIKYCEPHLGYIHRSIEKICEHLSFRQFSYLTSRMDYLSSQYGKIFPAFYNH